VLCVHSRTEWSCSPATRRLPSVENATEETCEVGVPISPSSRCERTSHRRIALSSPAETTVLLLLCFGEDISNGLLQLSKSRSSRLGPCVPSPIYRTTHTWPELPVGVACTMDVPGAGVSLVASTAKRLDALVILKPLFSGVTIHFSSGSPSALV
jgi:hypothetical protein